MTYINTFINAWMSDPEMQGRYRQRLKDIVRDLVHAAPEEIPEDGIGDKAWASRYLDQREERLLREEEVELNALESGAPLTIFNLPPL